MNQGRTLGLASILLTAAVLLAYAPVLRGLGQDWIHDPNYSHGFLIPVVSGFLVWQSRRSLAELPPAPSNAGILFLLLSLGLLIVGTAGAEVFTQRVSLVGLLASGVLFLAGWRWLGRVAFPLAFLLLAIPLPYLVYYGLTAPMQAIAAKAALAGLHLVGVPALAQGNIIHLPETSLEVAEACSGIRSLYAFLALGALLAHAMPIPFWARMAVFGLTIPLSVATNAIRVWGSGMAAYLIGPEATEGTIHELFGLIVFTGALGIFLLLRRGARDLWSPAS